MSDAFISYSRKDQAFVKILYDALALKKQEIWVDWQGIPPTAEWLTEVYGAINEANAFIFIISPDSISSDICKLELAHAISQNKRLIPILLKDVSTSDLHEEVRKINWLRMDEESLNTSIHRLLDTLNTDLDWVKGHTRLTIRATEWEQHNNDTSHLLRGQDLEKAEQWLAFAPDKTLAPTSLQSRYITTSRQLSNRRQRQLMGAITVGLVIAIGLAIFAWIQRDKAIDESIRAKSNLLSSQAVLALDYNQNPTLGFRHAAAAWKLNPDNVTAESLLLRSQYGDNTFSFRDKRYRPPMYRELDTTINFHKIHLSPDDKHIALISYSPDNNENLVQVMSIDGASIGQASGLFKTFSEDGRHFSTTDYQSKTGSVWNLKGELIITDTKYHPIFNQLKGTFSVYKDKIETVPHSSAILVPRKKTLKRIKPWTFVEGDPGIQLAVTYSKDQKMIAAYDNRRTYRIWHYKGKVLATFPKQKELITSSDFSQDGQYLAVSYSNGDIGIWHLKPNKKKELTIHDNKLVTLSGHSDTAYSVVFTTSGDRLISTARDGTIKTWDLAAFPVGSIAQPKKNAHTITFHPNQQRISTTSYPSAVILDYTGNMLHKDEGYFTKGLINSVATSHDANTIATAKGKQLLISSLVDNQKPISQTHQNDILSVTFSLSGTQIVTSDLQTIKIWDTKGKELAVINMGTIGGSVYKNKGKPYLIDTVDKHYILIQTDTNIRLLDLQGNDIKSIPGKLGSGFMDKEIFSPDLKTVIVTEGDHRMSLFDLNTMEIIAHTDQFPEHETFQLTRFSPEGDLVYAVIEFRGAVYSWNWKKDQIVQIDTLYQLESAQVIPALNRIITKAIDGMIRFWDMNGTELFVIENSSSSWVKLSPDHKYLAVQNINREGWPVELWDFDPAMLIEQAEQAGITAIDYQN
ncbi:MAG: TIR domain-containing protein [Candidatus Thiodiazotropha sp. (ex Lucinoma borealis)]|nr:TIR domain-containing protein [Candidatus Thiodiazotropha sp. (ex Lucinoma borealis)]